MVVENANLSDDQIRIVVSPTQTECLAQASRPAAQSPIGVRGSPRLARISSTPVSGSNARMRMPDPTPTG